MKKVKREKKNRFKRLRRLKENFKAIKWSKPKEVLAGVGSATVFTAFFIGLFALIDFISALLVKLF